jgi:hypothetical protein
MVTKPVKGERLRGTPPVIWLVYAASLHVASTLIVFLVGRGGLLPDQFDPNGIGTSFASDGTRYHTEAMALVKILSDDGIVAWLKASPQFHVKIYSLFYAAFGPLVGFNILAVEPLNALYYLAAIVLVFALGQQVFNRRASLLSALIIALWPSLLLHSTQLLRDPLLIVLWLILILILSNWLVKVLQWQQGLISALIAIAVSLAIWIVRMDLWILIRASAVLITVLVILRQLRERRVHFGNFLGAGCLLVVVMIVPQIFHAWNSPRGLAVIVRETTSPREQIMNRRRSSIVTEQAGATSSIDKGVPLNSTADIARYLPRAIEIGFFAPFPNTWFQKGSGSAKSLLVASETLAMYVIELCACLTLWRQRRRFLVWLLCLVAAMGMLGLGLVVVNMGTLYRLRYPFLILIIIVASETLMNLTALMNWKSRGGAAAALND